MKLISLYIEQFGGLRQYALDLSDGLTVIQEENGFGKTTLAEFIRAMFYGFPRKTRSLGRRQKYLPWSGGKCAGSLEFEYQGTRYRMERTFGATPKSDTFKLVESDTNRPSTRFTENIGVELFGLDADSFERSTYLPQNQDPGPLSTDGIRAKLSDLVEDTGDVGNFEKAAAALKAKRSSYALYRGVGGSAAEALARISALQIELDRCSQAERSLSQAQEEIRRLEARRQASQEALAQVRAQITQASQKAAAAAVQKQHAQLEQQYQAARADQARYTSRFLQGVPSLKELEDQRSKCSEYLTLAARAESIGLSPEEQEVLTGPWGRDAGALAELDTVNQRLEQAKEQYASIAAPSRGWLAALLLGLLGLVLGILLLGKGQALPGGILMGMSILSLALGGYLGLRTRKAQKERASLAQRIEDLTHQLEQALGQSCDFSLAIQEQRLRQLQHQELIKKKERIDGETAALTAQAQTLSRETAAFLSRYFPSPISPADYHRALDALGRERDAWARAEEQLARTAAALEAYRNEHSRELAQEPAPVPEPESLKVRECALNQELDQVTELLLSQRQLQSQLQEQTDRGSQLEDQLALWQEKKQADMEKAKLLDATLEYLQQAKDSLATSYLGPIRAGFARYWEKLSQAEAGRVHIDPDLNLQQEQLGQARELGYFSAGQTDLLMLCMRFALVDALFTGEKPFMILDDPFVNLDDRHTAMALALLQELSRERQILYLVCNSSRRI